jgi:hypothetical protein
MSVVPTIVTYKWRPITGYPLRFTSEDVNLLYDRMKEHYPEMQRFVCVTDDPKGLKKPIEIAKLADLHGDLPNPSWRRGPKCHRRLIAFSPKFERIAGPRFACVDIDIKPIAYLGPVFNRDEDFVGWRSGRQDGKRQEQFGGALLMMNAGARAQVWERFAADPAGAVATAHAAGYHGSDQAWISYVLDKDREAYWTEADGVYYYRKLVPKAHVIAQMRGPPRRTRREMRHGLPPRNGLTPRHMQLGYDAPNLVPKPENARLIIFSHGLHETSAATRIMSPWLVK